MLKDCALFSLAMGNDSMFLKKITTVKAVGRFRAALISGGEYGKYTLFYAGNGRGKTTLCAVLRSLQTNDPSYILKRRTFQALAAQEVQLLLDSGPVRFSAGAWSTSAPDLHIFDHHFINANVHGGHLIDELTAGTSIAWSWGQ